jgi:hypothetical protein
MPLYESRLKSGYSKKSRLGTRYEIFSKWY